MSPGLPRTARVVARLAPVVAPGPWRVRVLERVPRERLIVAFTAPRGGGRRARRVIGKFYADETGRRTFRVMREIARRLRQGPEGPLAIPCALGYDPTSRLLLQVPASGTPFTRFAGRPGTQRAFRQAGRALACLHGLPLRLGRRTRLPDHVRTLIRPHPHDLGAAFPEYRELVGSLLATIAARERAWRDRTDVTPLHRDFHLRQLFFDDRRGAGRVWLIDWDLFAKGDPAFDVAYFVVYLRSHLGARAERAVAAFLEGYTERRPSRALFDRLPTWEAFNYLRRACRRFRLRDPGWQGVMRAMLARAADVL